MSTNNRLLVSLQVQPPLIFFAKTLGVIVVFYSFIKWEFWSIKNSKTAPAFFL
jgi:hypothetical protein